MWFYLHMMDYYMYIRSSQVVFGFLNKLKLFIQKGQGWKIIRVAFSFVVDMEDKWR